MSAKQQPKIRNATLNDPAPKGAGEKYFNAVRNDIPNSQPEEDSRTVLTSDEGETIKKNPGMKSQAITGMKIVEIDGDEYQIERRDPYGFWYLIGINEDLGTFTGHREAVAGLMDYLRKKNEKENNEKYRD